MNAIKVTVAAAALLSAMSVGPALAEQNEIIALLNSAENDSSFAMLSYRRSLGASLEEGLSLRLDVSRGVFDVTGSEGTIDTARLMVGYSIALADNTRLTFYAGPSWRSRDYSVVLPGLEEFDDVGGFVSVELNSDLADGGQVFGLVEYDTTQELFYTSAFYQFGLGNVKLGPTFNYLQEGDYQRTAAGLRVTVPVTSAVDLTATGAWAEGDTGGPSIDSSYLEMQFRAKF